MLQNLRYSILIFFIFTGCSVDDEEVSGNLAPASFTVSVNNITDRSATIKWTPATDPEGKPVYYKIFINNTQLEEKFIGHTYELQQLMAEMDYSGKIIASDGENESVQNFSFSTNEFVPKIYEGNVKLTTQEEVNQFGAQNYNAITGFLDIGSRTYGEVTNITDITPLENLQKVEGNLLIENSSLENLKGLENLIKVGGNLMFNFNTKLKTLEGLEGLQSITNSLNIHDNPLLTDTNSLAGVDSIEEIYITFNHKLETIFLLPDAQRVNYIYILANASLKKIEGFEKIKEVNRFIEIIENGELIVLPAFAELVTIEGNLIVVENNKLEYLSFPKLGKISLSMRIRGNDMLDNLQGFKELKSVGKDLEFLMNPKLSNFCNLTTLVKEGEVGDQFKILYNLYNPQKEDIQAGDCKL